jgi:Ca2+-transporting ATPase
MDVGVGANRGLEPTGAAWYSRSPEDVALAFGVDVPQGLTASEATNRLQANGPNALPEEKPRPGWLRFLDEYRSYMQVILVAAAIVSLVISQLGTAFLLVVLTLINAVVGMRQQGKADSAMNALRSMMKASARVRRDGDEAESPRSRSLPATWCCLAPAIRCPPTVAS